MGWAEWVTPEEGDKCHEADQQGRRRIPTSTKTTSIKLQGNCHRDIKSCTKTQNLLQVFVKPQHKKGNQHKYKGAQAVAEEGGHVYQSSSLSASMYSLLSSS